VSGYKEAVWRDAQRSIRFVKRGPDGFNATAEAVTILRALFDAREHRLPHQIHHVFPQSGILYEWEDVDYIGRLETMETDWATMLLALPRENPNKKWPPPFQFPKFSELDQSAGSHPEEEQSEFKAGLLEAFRLYPELLAGVRVLLLPDTLCFGD
jgi:hypothetical protein